MVKKKDIKDVKPLEELQDFERAQRIISWLIFERKVNNRRELADIIGYKESYLSQMLNGKVPLSEKFLAMLNDLDNRVNVEWIKSGQGEILVEPVNVSGVLINGDNTNSPIDNRHYYSDSPDVLRAQIDMLDERIKEKEAQLKEKDAQIREKDAQIREKDAQIREKDFQIKALIEIMSELSSEK